MKQVWLVTGASKGLGLALVKELLAEGHSVAATSRTSQALIEKIGPASAQFLPLEVQLANEENIRTAITKIKQTFGRLDVLVNNAGYGQFGAVEEVSDQQARENFEVNVFGMMNMIRASLPLMREQKSGHIFNISSIGGYVGSFPGVGVYCATKFAVAGLSEGLKAETASLGIKVTLVYPGYFRTDFLSSESMAVPAVTIPEYKEAQVVLNAHVNEIASHQAGDPKRAAQEMMKMAQVPQPAFHLFLGKDSYAMALTKIEEVKAEMSQWKSVSESTDL